MRRGREVQEFQRKYFAGTYSRLIVLLRQSRLILERWREVVPSLTSPEDESRTLAALISRWIYISHITQIQIPSPVGVGRLNLLRSLCRRQRYGVRPWDLVLTTVNKEGVRSTRSRQEPPARNSITTINSCPKTNPCCSYLSIIYIPSRSSLQSTHCSAFVLP